ncbi:MAG: hypothetical protein ABI688_05315, partial [Bacteroidota bacterium]
MKNKVAGTGPSAKMIGVAIVLFFLFNSMIASAQTKKLVLKNFTFYPLLTLKSTGNPFELPFESKAASMLVQVDETKEYENVQDFLDDYDRPVKKSQKIETINGLTGGWVITKSEDDAHTMVLAGMV